MMTLMQTLQRPFRNPATARLISIVWLTALAAYIVGGASLTPFHGDEATQIAMSRDYASIFLQGDLDKVRYQTNPPDPADQELRLINGVVNKYLIGVAWHLGGFTAADLNQQWDWGADYAYNVANGHMPSAELLAVARLPSALLLAAGLLPMFALGWLIGGRVGAFAATLLYALHPALLVDGRRAMMEGSLIAFSLFTVLAGIWYARSRSWLAGLALGAAAGLALASKHTAVFTLAAVYGACLLLIVTNGWKFVLKRTEIRQSEDGQEEVIPASITLLRGGFPLAAAAKLVASAVLALALFYALNPAWWGDPIGRAGDVLRLRNDLLNGQVQAFGGYASTSDRLSGWLRQAFVPEAQYYEVSSWESAINGEITRYQESIFDGMRDLQAAGIEGVLFDLLLPLIALAGFAVLVGARGNDGHARLVILIWALTMAVTTALLTPLEWQRYYLPMHPASMLLVAAGLSWSVRPAGAPPVPEETPAS